MLAYTFTHIHTYTHKHHFFPGTAVLNAAGTQAFHWHDTWKENLNVFLLISPLFHSERERKRERWGELKDEDRPTWGLHDLYSRC